MSRNLISKGAVGHFSKLSIFVRQKKCTNRRVHFLVHLCYESTLLCMYYLICPAVELTELYIETSVEKGSS